VQRRLAGKGSAHVGKDCSRLLEYAEPRSAGDMRRHDHVGKRREAIARLPRLEAMHVEPGTRDRAGGQGIEQRVLIHQPPAAGVDEEGSSLHGCKGCPADKPIVRPDIRGMQRDEVGFRKQGVEGTIGYAERLLARRRQPGAVGVDDRHAEGACALDDENTYLPEPYDPERVAWSPPIFASLGQL
jgi:hypothetical protein